MSADQTNVPAVTRLPDGSYRGVIADGALLHPIALRTMDETGVDRVRIQLGAYEPGVDHPIMYTFEMDRSGVVHNISPGPGVVNSNN
ncbi:hypothetical protein FMEXI_13791 [Fusarium mexicanum]|uniref:Uncharacterized protein n=1 Tax=Fusarium mexicanum TaxID=751941 RepID=A0A8H5MJA8_9HYPO|nr:hypothetical protein FMEXI_13791 [Fusarium mexicanum]